MTPEELALVVPRLYHLTAPDAVAGIRARGLLTPENICERLGLGEGERERLLRRRRPLEVRLEGDGEVYVVNDNAPLFTDKLAGVLQDGLAPADWLAMLNARTFFWADERFARSLRAARNNRDRPRTLLVFDTLSLARAHRERMELCPINSGATLHTPPPRGLATFAPLVEVEYDAWRRARRERGEKKGLDTIKEVTVRGGVPDAFEHVVEVVDDLG